MSRKEVAIVGGGLVGSLLAVLLARRDHDVTIYEKRADPRAASAEAGRSINLIVTSRGEHALRACGLWERVEPLESDGRHGSTPRANRLPASSPRQKFRRSRLALHRGWLRCSSV